MASAVAPCSPRHSATDSSTAFGGVGPFRWFVRVKLGGLLSRNTCALAAAAMALGLVASACHSSPHSSTTTTSQATPTQLQSLIPTPANTQRTDGPAPIPDNGIHMHFLVNGSSRDVLDAYKTALEGKGWTATTGSPRIRAHVAVSVSIPRSFCQLLARPGCKRKSPT